MIGVVGIPTIPTPKLSIRQEVVGSTLFLRDSTDVDDRHIHSLNCGESVVWQLCNGSRNVHQIVAAIATAYGLPFGEARQRVEDTLQQFHRLGLLEN